MIKLIAKHALDLYSLGQNETNGTKSDKKLRIYKIQKRMLQH